MIRNPERFARFVTALRHRRRNHRRCCSHNLSYQLLSRALDWYDGNPVTTTHLADRMVIMSMASWDSDYSHPVSKAARWLYRAIDAKAP